jgi:hypothetical protein
MKKQFTVPLLFILFSILFILFISCTKNNNSCRANTEEQDRHTIDSFLTANGQENNIIYDDSLKYYKGILDIGTGDTATGKNSRIFYDVVWRLLNGTTIDSTRYPTSGISGDLLFGDLYLNSAGPFYNLTLYKAFSGLKAGGIYRVINLSRSMYGCSDMQFANTDSTTVTIPVNSQIMIDYRLVDVKNP